MDPIDSNKVNFLVCGDNFLFYLECPCFWDIQVVCLVTTWHKKLIWQIVIHGTSRERYSTGVHCTILDSLFRVKFFKIANGGLFFYFE